MHAALGIAERASAVIMEIYRRGFSVQHKADSSPVTEADLAADRLIVDALAAIAPGYPVISEESDCPAYSERAGWHRYWLVDPLDGTHGFVRRSGEFAVNVALVEKHRPVIGVVSAPAEGIVYFARAGAGAYRRNRDGQVTQISARGHPRDPIRVITSRSRRNPLTRDYIAALGAVDIERLGSALKSCRIAEGRADVYPGFSRTSEWDTAAAQCVLEEAGGRLMDVHGRPLRYNCGPDLDNPRFLAVGDGARDWLRMLPRGAMPEGKA